MFLIIRGFGPISGFFYSKLVSTGENIARWKIYLHVKNFQKIRFSLHKSNLEEYNVLEVRVWVFAGGGGEGGFSRHRLRNLPNCRRYQRHRRQILPPVPLVLLTPVAKIYIYVNSITQRCPHRRQILPPVPLVLLTPVAKIYIYVNSITQRCPNKIINIFLLEDFFHLPPVSRHRWCNLSRKYLRKFSKKFEMAEVVYSDAWGKLIHEKNQKSKISWHCPFKHGLLNFWLGAAGSSSRGDKGIFY